MRNRRLHLAVQKGCIQGVCNLLDVGADANAPNQSSNSALHYTKSAAITEILLNHGANINVLNKNHETPLHLASRGGHKEKAIILLKHKADINARDEDGDTALMMACSLDMTKLLLKNGADINAKNNNGRAVLHQALASEREELVSVLLDHGADANSIEFWDQHRPLHCARSGRMVKLLLEHGAHVDAKDGRDRTALHVAVHRGLEETVLALLENLADPNAPDSNGRSAIFKARSGSIARLLILFGANIHVRDSNGLVALHRAAQDGSEDTVQLLIEHGADVNVQDQYGQSALFLAKAKSIARLLLTFGADVNIRDKNLSTALHWAATNGRKGVLLALLECGADVNSRDYNGRIAFHCAASSGENAKEVVEILLEHGSEIMIRDMRGYTPLDLAITRNLTTPLGHSPLTFVKLHIMKKHYNEAKQNLETENTPANKRLKLGQGQSARVSRERYQTEFERECVNELQNFEDTNLPALEILTTNYPLYVLNETTVNLLATINDIEYPLYGQMIQSKFESDQCRMTLLSQSQQLFNTFLKNSNSSIPEELGWKILCYLKNNELVQFIRRCGSLGNRSH